MRTAIVLSALFEPTTPWRTRGGACSCPTGACSAVSCGAALWRSRARSRQRRRSAAFLRRASARSANRSSAERGGRASPVCAERPRFRRSLGPSGASGSPSSGAEAAAAGAASAGASAAGAASSAGASCSCCSGFCSSSGMGQLPDLGFHVQTALPGHGQGPSQVPLRLPQPRRVLQLPGCVLEAEVEQLLAGAVHEVHELGVVEVVHLGRLHWPAPSRITNLVFTGSLWPARRMASRARSSGTPESSNITRPGLTTATQPSGLPLPEPMRVSAGLLVMGLSGKTLIHTLPPRLILRVIAIRAASIWRFVTQPRSSDLSPY